MTSIGQTHSIPPEELTIGELLTEKIKSNNIGFKIPGYQRGYKWTEQQAKQLLDDLISYGNQQHLINIINGDYCPNEEASDYYLQPISVCPSPKNQEGSEAPGIKYYDVIDGQQRLTTIWLLLYVCHKKKLRCDTIEEPTFDILYDTFQGWQSDFKDAIKNDNLESFQQKSLNHFHVSQVYSLFDKRISKKYRKGKEIIKASTLYEILWNRTKIIWSEISTSDNQDKYNKDIKTFSNLNSGKIPLTCGELIKGLILQENNFREVGAKTDSFFADEDHRLLSAIQNLIKSSREAKIEYDKIAREWDAFERELHNESLWHFIYNKETNYVFETRLEYIFNLIKQVDRGDEKMKAFNSLYDEMKNEAIPIDKKIKDFWDDKVVNYMATIREWYKDKEYYHLIGYLVATTPWIKIDQDDDKMADNNEKKCKKKTDKTVISYFINGLYEKKWNKAVLRSKIKELILESLATSDDDNKGEYDIEIDGLRYKQDNDIINRILLFFNIHTILMQEGEERFPFNRYKEEKWDIEHIASQTEFDAFKKNKNEAKLWALAVLQYFTGINVDEFVEQGTISHGKNSFLGKQMKKLEPQDEVKIKDAIDETYPEKETVSSEDGAEIEDAVHSDKTDSARETNHKKKLCNLLLGFITGKDDNIEDIQGALEDLGFFGNSIGPDTEDGEENDDKHRIGNLTLLNMSINRGYGNAIFPVKRITIQEELQKGYFVPPCTQRVFQKAYSRKFDQLYVWDKSDVQAYTEAIKEALRIFKEGINGSYAEYKSSIKKNGNEN